MAAEIRAKCSTITGVGASLRSKVLANDRIATKTKANIFQAILLSRILFNAGAWPILTSAEHARIHTAILKHTRTIAASDSRRYDLAQDKSTPTPTQVPPIEPTPRSQAPPTTEDAPEPATDTTTNTKGMPITCPTEAPPGPTDTAETSTDRHAWLSDQKVYETTGLCAPFVAILRLRLLLLIRVLTSSPAPLRWALSAAAPARRSWICAARHDVEWLAKHTEEFQHWKGSSFEDVCANIAHQPRPTRAAINKVKRNMAYSDKQLWATTATLRNIDVQLPCLTCGEVFDSRQALSAHANRDHGAVRDIRTKVNTQWCAACLQHFGSIERVVCHLKEKATRCMATYIMAIDDLDHDDQLQAKQAATAEARSCCSEGQHRAFARTPVMRMPGPLSLHATLAGICHTRLLRDGMRSRTLAEVMDAVQAQL